MCIDTPPACTGGQVEGALGCECPTGLTWTGSECVPEGECPGS